MHAPQEKKFRQKLYIHSRKRESETKEKKRDEEESVVKEKESLKDCERVYPIQLLVYLKRPSQ